MALRVLIADDDINILNFLREFLKGMDNVELVGEVTDGSEVLKLISDLNPDVVFLDIDMPGVNGINAGKMISELNKNIYIIFITGFGDFRDQALMMHAFDYIEKPIDREKQERIIKDLKDIEKSSKTFDNETVFIKFENNMIAIKISDIIFFEKQGKKMIIYTEEGVYETYYTMDYWQNILKNKNYTFSFFKTHKSYLVNISKIKKIHSFYTSYQIEFYGTNKKAILSRNYIKPLQDRIKWQKV